MPTQSTLKSILPPPGLPLAWQCCAPWAASFDLRISPYKASVVDANLFPAGWSHLSENARQRAALSLRAWASRMLLGPGATVLLLPESHTRNTGYWSNVATQLSVLQEAGLSPVLGWMMEIPLPGEVMGLGGEVLRPAAVRREGDTLWVGDLRPDAVLLNHDLSGALPGLLAGELTQPLYPHSNLGWQNRRKDTFFLHLERFAMELAPKLNLDPWQISVYTRAVHELNVDSREDLQRAADTAQELMDLLADTYRRHGVTETPRLFFKSASGTYGMSVKVIERPEDLLALNSRDRYKLRTGKGKTEVRDYLLQEAVPTCQQVDGAWAETVVMAMAGVPVGGYYRYHAEKGPVANLNSTGMNFVPMGDEVFEALGGTSLSAAAAWIAMRAVACEVTRSTPGHLLRAPCPGAVEQG